MWVYVCVWERNCGINAPNNCLVLWKGVFQKTQYRAHLFLNLSLPLCDGVCCERAVRLYVFCVDYRSKIKYLCKLLRWHEGKKFASNSITWLRFTSYTSIILSAPGKHQIEYLISTLKKKQTTRAALQGTSWHLYVLEMITGAFSQTELPHQENTIYRWH